MKRYLIFAALGPFIGGFLLLFATSYQSGYWAETNAKEVAKLFVVFAKTLQYAYLFGIVPSLMLGAVDDILFHLPKIRPVLRMLIIGLLGFAAAELLYGSRGPDTGGVQFILYGLVGFVPATLSSWLSHKYAQAPQAVTS
jgi:Zn-dependent protease with chaperone function